MTDIKVVIGANLGDEGKGLMTDFFCQQASLQNRDCIVVLANGGSQRGHTVDTTAGISHVFHHFGSGTFSGASSYFSKFFILNAMNFVREWDELFELGYSPVSFSSPMCKWSTPFDMLVNQIVETQRDSKRHGSCGVGIWETEVRYATKPMLLNIHAFNKLAKDKKFEMLRDLRDGYYIDRLNTLGVSAIPDEYKEIFYSSELIYHFISDVQFMCEHMPMMEENSLKLFGTVVFENGQGLLLDQSLEEFYGDNLTPSNTGSQNSVDIINRTFGTSANVELCYVSRTYMTRHGAGRFETECAKSLLNASMVDSNNITNEFQGNLRYGELILPNLISRVKGDASKYSNATVSLAMTHTNEYNNVDYDMLLNEFKVYTSNAKTNDSIVKLR